MYLNRLKQYSRLLIKAQLRPLQGTRFQPTGFPDLGPATYRLPDGREMLLVESAQSIANRLEITIWDDSTQDIIQPLQGISYVVVKQGDKVVTNSLLEAHRLNSYYMLEGQDKSFFEQLRKELDLPEEGAVDMYKFAQVLAKYDINSLLHGIFLAKKEIGGGRFRLARALTGFIEAENVTPVISGGVKNDRVNPKAEAKKGGGNVPYTREEYTAEKITAYFSLDLAQIRGYRLGNAVEELLISIALYKILSFLDSGLRLRTACDFECFGIEVTNSEGMLLPKLEDIIQELPSLVKAASEVFNDNPVTVVNYQAEVNNSIKDKDSKKNARGKKVVADTPDEEID